MKGKKERTRGPARTADMKAEEKPAAAKAAPAKKSGKKADAKAAAKEAAPATK